MFIRIQNEIIAIEAIRNIKLETKYIYVHYKDDYSCFTFKTVTEAKEEFEKISEILMSK